MVAAPKPVDPGPKPPDGEREARVIEYLTTRGWQPTINGKWIDPKPGLGKVERRQEVLLPDGRGGVEHVTQTFVPPVPWSYHIEQALEIAVCREMAGETLEELILAREAELADLKAKLAAEQGGVL
jgi:hypothetical protein